MNNRINEIINNITKSISNLRRGDYVILDLDNTVLLTGMKKYQDIVKITEKGLSQQIEIIQNSLIPVIGLTARSDKYKTETLNQLASVNIKCDWIIHAPTLKNKLKEKFHQKGIELKKYLDKLQVKPKRLIIIDDNSDQLASIAEAMKNESLLYYFIIINVKIIILSIWRKSVLHFPII